MYLLYCRKEVLPRGYVYLTMPRDRAKKNGDVDNNHAAGSGYQGKDKIYTGRRTRRSMKRMRRMKVMTYTIRMRSIRI